MKISVFSYYPVERVAEAVRKHGFETNDEHPDVVITFGGDGTLLTSEKKHPGIPKVAIKKSGICARCFECRLRDIGSILDGLKSGRFEIIRYNKVEAKLKGRKLTALNEVQVHNKDPRRALRFSLEADGKRIDNIIGDGIVAATAFGSTAYYRVIGYKPFDKGVRIGFNNTVPKPDALILGHGRTARVEILREDGYVTADNSELVEAGPGDVVLIRESRNRANFIKINPK
jgi:NAD+ kinase